VSIPGGGAGTGTIAPVGPTPFVGGEPESRVDRRTRSLVVVAREVTHINELTSSGSFGAALRLAIPILLAGLGALYAERSGIVNIGLEGMMILGTWFGAWAGWKYGAGWGVLAGIAGGGMGGLLHAIATVTFGVDQIISGVAINILGFGVARFLSVVAYTGSGEGGATQSPHITGGIAHMSVPLISGGHLPSFLGPFARLDPLGWLEKHHWFLISDAAALLRGLTHDLSWLTVGAIALVPLTFFILWRTRLGLRIRSVGEHPLAAESLGVPVYTMKYIAVTISGMLAGLGGAYLVIEQASIYREGQTAGRGFIGLAALIFGNYRPGGVAAAAGIFGYANALQLRSDKAVHALLLFVAMGLALGAIWFAWHRRGLVTALTAGFAGAVFLWWNTSDKVPREFIFFTPHIVTLLVLALATQRLRPPAADGRPYRKGQT
jgi:general nucleoside transport system permease protein